MHLSFFYLVSCLVIGISVIVVLTAKYKLPAFFALLIASFVVGLGVQLPLPEILAAIKEGFGNIMKSLALIIILGTTLGLLLEHTGSTRVMANFILRKVGESRAPLAISITGFVVGLPIFCDSGYIVLAGLNQSITKRTGIPITVMATSLATGLYAVHCLIPPHPGAAAAAGLIGVDFGRLLVMGIVVAIPAAVAGYLWARFAGKKGVVLNKEQEPLVINSSGPSISKAFLPVVVPIILIALKAFVSEVPAENRWFTALLSLGDPVIALSIGVLLAMSSKPSWNRTSLNSLLQQSVENAGGILIIIGAGGAFGAVLAATKIGNHVSASLPLESLGIFFPFLLTSVLKTAQGSSTVAIITAASLVQPLLPALGLAAGAGPLLCVLAMGAGSMMISHANDAYFWVIAKFSGLDMKNMLRVYTVATVLMGLTSFVVIYVLSKIL